MLPERLIFCGCCGEVGADEPANKSVFTGVNSLELLLLHEWKLDNGEPITDDGVDAPLVGVEYPDENENLSINAPSDELLDG
jgi:hypothetical protein